MEDIEMRDIHIWEEEIQMMLEKIIVLLEGELEPGAKVSWKQMDGKARTV